MTVNHDGTGMTADAAALLAGPRGRRLCLEYAMAANPVLWEVMFWLAHDAAPEGSTLLTFSDGDGDGSASAGEHIPPDFTVADATALIAATDVHAIDDAQVRAALRASVDAAMYWQPPDGRDVVCAMPEIRAALVPLAEALLASPVGATWSAGYADAQWAARWQTGSETALLPTDATALLAAWSQAQREDEARAARDRPRDPRAMWSGAWWSAPSALLSTRRHAADALELVEDDAGLDVATVVLIRGGGGVRALEIASALDWAELCRAFPLEVTASRRHDWFRVTGRDGRWLIPDWPRVALSGDAVHLTTFAYLCAATTLIEIDDEYASVIGGWGPDATLWLTDTARESSEPRQHWVRPEGSGDWEHRG